MAHPDQFASASWVSRSPWRAFYLTHGKRAVDLALSFCLLPILLPVIAVLWLLVRLDGGTGFFGHHRIGRNGRRFRCYKIRTMIPDADLALARVLKNDPQAAREWARTHKLTNDPRVTRLGQFLRRTSLDELPQIVNVLKGDMSLVGPRPVTEDELDRYGLYRGVYLSLRPGITGLWQIRGRANGCYVERLDMDRAYAAGIGLTQDLSLIAQTARVLVFPTGR